MATVNEHDNVSLTIQWIDEDGDEVPAESIEEASYRIDDVESGQEIRDDTTIDPDSEITIPLTYNDNRILDPTNQSEMRRVTATAIFGTDEDGDPEQITVEFEYEVRNLRFHP